MAWLHPHTFEYDLHRMCQFSILVQFDIDLEYSTAAEVHQIDDSFFFCLYSTRPATAHMTRTVQLGQKETTSSLMLTLTPSRYYYLPHLLQPKGRYVE